MSDRDINKKILWVFIVCAVTITTVNWVIQEKFIADARIAFFVNCAVAVAIAFLYTRYLDNKLNRSIDLLLGKIQSIYKGDLTQRFKEDPDDIIPAGLSYELDEMMKFFRERIGGLWKLSALLIKQLDQFVSAIQEALDDFRREVAYFASIGNNLEDVRHATLDMAKKFSDLTVNTQSDLITVEQVHEKNKATVSAVKEYKGLIRAISSDIQEISVLADRVTVLLDDFKGLSRTMLEISKSMTLLSTESNLVKLNASIDSAQKQAPDENYRKLIEEMHNLLEKIGAIAQKSDGVSLFTENKISDVSYQLKDARKRVSAGLDDAEKIEKFLAALSEHVVEAASLYGTVLDKIRNLNNLMNDAQIKRTVFSKTMKVSIDHFDKLKADTQITLVKFNRVEDKIAVIKENIKLLELFKNLFQIG